MNLEPLEPRLMLSAVIALGLDSPDLQEPMGMDLLSDGRIVVADADADAVFVYNPDGSLDFTFGSYGSGIGQFNHPCDVAVDGQDRIWVADSFNNRIQIFDSTGNYLDGFGTMGTDPGQLYQPMGIELDQAGHIYVAEYMNNRVQRFNPDYTLDTSWAGGDGILGTGDVERDHTGFAYPRGLAIHPQTGNLYVADMSNHRVEIFDSAGNYTDTILGVYKPYDLVFDSDYNIYFVGDSPHKSSFAAEQSSIRFMAAGDTFLSRFYIGGIDDLGYLTGGIVITSDGDIVVSDSYNHRLVRTDASFTEPITDLRVIDNAAGSATICWHTAEPVRSVVQYGPTNSYGSSVTDPTPTTEHVLTLTGLDPSSRYHYCVNFLESFTHEETFTSDQIMQTGPADPTQGDYLHLRSIGAIYTYGRTQQQIDAAYQWFERVEKFYWINSRFNLHLDIEVVEIDRQYTSDDVTSYGFFKASSLQADLEDLGYTAADDIDHAVVYFGGVPGVPGGNYGGSSYMFGRRVGYCSFTTGSQWIPIHEINHTIDSIYSYLGMSGYEFCHGLWNVQNQHGKGWTVNGQIPRNMRDEMLAAGDGVFDDIRTALDSDGDGVFDNDPDLPVTEATLGTDPNKVDTDGDGLSDLQEAIMGAYYPSDGANADTDGDGVADAADLNPLHPVANFIGYATPTLDGHVEASEGWTLLTDHYQFENNFYSDSNNIGNNALTYIAWDENYLYFAYIGPSTNLEMRIDGDADGWYLSADNYHIKTSMYSVTKAHSNVAVPDLFWQIDNDGQWSEVFDDNVNVFQKPYNGNPPYSDPDSGLGYGQRFVTEGDILFAGAPFGSMRTVELAIPYSDALGFEGHEGKKMSMFLKAGDDVFFETDDFVRFILSSDTQPPQTTYFTVNNFQNSRSQVDSLWVFFSEDVDINPEAVQLNALTVSPGPVQIDPSQIVYDSATHSVKINFNAPLPDDNYELLLFTAGVRDLAGIPLAETDGLIDGYQRFSFHVLKGDVDGNRVVDGLDLTMVISAFGTSEGDPLWDRNADSDHNGVVDGLDLTAVLCGWGHAMPEPTLMLSAFADARAKPAITGSDPDSTITEVADRAPVRLAATRQVFEKLFARHDGNDSEEDGDSNPLTALQVEPLLVL